MERLNKDRKYAFKPSKYADVCDIWFSKEFKCGHEQLKKQWL